MNKQGLTTEPPKGLALYVRKIVKSRHKSPAKFARLCADHGLKWIALATIWHDRKGGNRELTINPVSVVKEYSQALAEAGVNPHIWGYPWHNRIKLFVEQTAAYLNPWIVGVLLDPELGLKDHLAEAIALFKAIRALNPYLLVGLTSYGLPRGHRNFPFSAFAEAGERGNVDVECDYGSPQLYDLPVGRILEGLADYDRLGFDHIVPSFGNYKNVMCVDGKKRAISLLADELDAHLNHFVESPVPIPGAIGWAENFMNSSLWDVLARWSEVFEHGGTIQTS
jgi:hypothetical protein